MKKLIFTTILLLIYTAASAPAILVADSIGDYQLLAVIITGFWLPAFGLWFSVNQPALNYLRD